MICILANYAWKTDNVCYPRGLGTLLDAAENAGHKNLKRPSASSRTYFQKYPRSASCKKTNLQAYSGFRPIVLVLESFAACSILRYQMDIVDSSLKMLEKAIARTKTTQNCYGISWLKTVLANETGIDTARWYGSSWSLHSTKTVKFPELLFKDHRHITRITIQMVKQTAQ